MIQERAVRLPSLLRLRYLQAGEEGQPAVVCLSGQGLTADFYQRNLPALAEAGYSAYALDRPGFGGSSGPREISLPYYARLLEEFLDARGIERAAFIGNSLGATDALQLYLSCPERVSALILVDAFGVGARFRVTPKMVWNVSLPSLWLGIFGRSDWAYTRMVKGVFNDPAQSTLEIMRVDKGLFWMLRGPSRAASILAMVRSLGLPQQRRNWMDRIRKRYKAYPVPVLIVWGAWDVIVPVEDAYETQAAFPGARLHIYPECGHHPPAECADDFNRRAVEFLGSTPRD